MIGDWIKCGMRIAVIDKGLDEIIIHSTVKNYKETSGGVVLPARFITFDEEYFVSTDNPKFDFVRTYDCNREITLSEETLKKYKTYPWKQYKTNESADFYREFSKADLDPEVENLVNALNTIEGVRTTGSCCGHGEYELYVDCIFNSLSALKTLENIIFEDEFRNVFYLGTFITLMPCEGDNDVIFQIRTRKTFGQQAYEAANRLAERLKHEKNKSN